MKKPELIVALDVPSIRDVSTTLETLPQVSWFKVGLELFTAAGPAVIQELRQNGRRVFLDLKLHDIPRTVERAVCAASAYGAELLTVHAVGGRAMLRAAADAARAAGAGGPAIVAVTTLTSLGPEDLRDIGVERSVAAQALALGELAISSGVHGLVTSVHEAAVLRRTFGPEAILVTPGIRPSDSPAGDQKRIATPKAAVENGATYLVVGRPVLESADPRKAADGILREIEETRKRTTERG